MATKKKKTGLTREDRIKTVFGGGGHVVILGAGASIASTLRNPEPGGKKLPSMDNFIDVVGLRAIVNKVPDKLKAENFEQLYSNLHNDNPKSDEIREIERRVRNYFSDMRLPDGEATIYDFLPALVFFTNAPANTESYNLKTLSFKASCVSFGHY